MATTVLSRLDEHAREQPTAPACFQKDDGVWRATDWATYRRQVRRIARALIALGLEPKGKVGVLGFNRPEWSQTALGAAAAGGAAAGVYTTSAPNQVAYVLRHARCRVVVVENAEQREKVRRTRAELPDLRWLVTIEESGEEPAPGELDWSAFLAHAEEVAEDRLDARLADLEDDGLATLIYTSGTTGEPKAVMLSHANLWSTARICEQLATFGPGDSMVSYLPLAHIAEQMLTVYLPLYGGYPIYYAESIEKLAENLREVEPTVVFGVPRVWERIAEAVGARLAATRGLRRRLLDWALGAGRRAAEVANRGERPGPRLALESFLADRLVQRKVRRLLGLARARFCISGAAPIPPAVLHFFAGLGVTIYEVYGQSETCGPTTWNRPGRARFGTVGPPLPEVEVRLAADGEVLVRGPNVFQGYLDDPEATAESFEDGWLRSGDLGVFDERGLLSITGRKKEILITSGGKNVAPAALEGELKQLELVAEAMVLGDGRKYLTALLTPNLEALARFARREGLEAELEAGALRDHPRLLAELQGGIDAVNERRARVEQIRRFRLLPAPFSVELGELTPTLKVRRNVVAERYAAEIEAMYAD